VVRVLTDFDSFTELARNVEWTDRPVPISGIGQPTNQGIEDFLVDA
jgi:hypothetical protein